MSHVHADDAMPPDPSTELRTGRRDSRTGSAAVKSQSRLTIVLGLTTVYTLVEVAGGLLTNSLALLADAGHMLIDVLGLGMAVAAISFAQRSTTPAKTYGFYRTEILAALANSIVLFGVASYILYEAWRRVQDPPVIDSLTMMGVAVGGLIINLIGAWLLYGGAGDSLNVRGAFLEVIADLLGSLGVILAGGIVYFTSWWQADPLVSVAIGLFILPRTWGLLKSALDVLLEAAPSHIKMAEVESAMRAVPGVASLHDLHIWTITTGFVAMSGHVLAVDRPCGDVLHDLRLLLRQRFGVEHTTLQVEHPEHADDDCSCGFDPRCLMIGTEISALAAVAGETSEDLRPHIH